MAVQKPKQKDLKKLRDEHFEKALNSECDNEKVQSLFEAISLSKKLKKPSDDFHVWIEYKADGVDVNGDEYTLVRYVY